MLATFSNEQLDEMLKLTNGHLDHLAFVVKYVRFKRPFSRITPDTIKIALSELETTKGYVPPPSTANAGLSVAHG